MEVGETYGRPSYRSWARSVSVAEGKNVTEEFRVFDSEARPRRGVVSGCGWLVIV